MGYPLHGQDLSLDITPVQARCGWAVGWKKPAFWGRDVLLAEKEAGARRLTWGLEGLERAIPRSHMAVASVDGTPVGEVTSGTFSPTRRLGIALALLERGQSGQGQIVDAAMVDGSAYLSTFVYRFRNAGFWRDERGTNMLDGGAPFYDTYRTQDGRYMSVGAIEPQFYAALLQGLGLDAASMPQQMDQSAWPATAARFSEIFAGKTRDEWCAIFDGTDACVAPVLGLGEVGAHPHNRVRALLIADRQGKLDPAPAPRLSRTPGDGSRPLPTVGDHTHAVLAEYGFSAAEITRLTEAGAIA
jgi:alpha-methylacyl-CoA racemase